MFSVLPTFVCNVSCVCVSTINSCPKLCYVRAWGHLKSDKEQVSRGGTNNYIPQYLWDVITCPCPHYSDVIMSAMLTQTPGVSIVYSTVFTGVDQRKHLSSVSLTFVKGIHYLLVIGKFPTGRASNVEMFPFDDVIMPWYLLLAQHSLWMLPHVYVCPCVHTCMCMFMLSVFLSFWGCVCACVSISSAAIMCVISVLVHICMLNVLPFCPVCVCICMSGAVPKHLSWEYQYVRAS